MFNHNIRNLIIQKINHLYFEDHKNNMKNIFYQLNIVNPKQNYDINNKKLNHFNQFIFDADFTPKIKKTLMRMFNGIQEPFNELFHGLNFFNYSFILYKCTELLKINNLKSLYPLFINDNRINSLDNSWKYICIKLNWTFIPTI